MADVVLPEQIRIDRWIKRKMHNIDLTLVMVCYDYEGVCRDTSELDFAWYNMSAYLGTRDLCPRSKPKKTASKAKQKDYDTPAVPPGDRGSNWFNFYPHKTVSHQGKSSRPLQQILAQRRSRGFCLRNMARCIRDTINSMARMVFAALLSSYSTQWLKSV